jgi:hypothetical protein
MNRKSRRAQAKAKWRRSAGSRVVARPQAPPASSEFSANGTFAEHFQRELTCAISRVVPPGTKPEEVPAAEIMRGLMMMAAAFAAQGRVASRGQFGRAAEEYYQGVVEGLRQMGVHFDEPKDEPEGPTLVLP